MTGKRLLFVFFPAFAFCTFLARSAAAQANACGPLPIDSCTTYKCVNGKIEVTTNPGATCKVGGQTGVCSLVLQGTPPSNLTQGIYCAGPYTISVTVSGLNSGNSLVLQDNEGLPLTVSGNGSFVFPTHVFSGWPYEITVQTQPAGQACAPGNGASGTVNSANVVVSVTCLNFSVWEPVGPAPVANPGRGSGGNAGRVNVAVADPKNPAVIYVGSAGGGIWKTSNAAQGATPTWQALTDQISAPNAQPSGLASLQIGGSAHALSIHPANDSLIQAVVYYSGGGVLVSNSAGASGTWSLSGNSQNGQGLFDGWGMTSIAVHPANQQTAFVATANGLYQTINGGLTWDLVQGGLPAPSSATTGDYNFSPAVYDVIFARFDPNYKTLFAAVTGNSGSYASLNGVYRSTDGGSSWTILSLPNSPLSYGTWPNNIQGGIQLDSGSNKALYVSMLTLGNTIPTQPCGTPPPAGWQINAVQRFVSVDQGASWTPLGPTAGGLETRTWHQLIAVDPQNDSHVVTDDCYSLYESFSSGQAGTWARIDSQLGYDWVSVGFDANGKELSTADQGLFRYDPTGKTWESLNGNLEITTFYTISDAGGGQALAGTAQDQYSALLDNKGQPNAVWQYLSAGGETGKVLFPPTGVGYAYLYFPLSDNSNDLVWRAQVTQPSGLQPNTSWTPIFSQNIYGMGKSNYGFAYTSQRAFVMDPFDSRRLLVGADQVYETTNADYSSPSWNPIGPPAPSGEQPYVTALAVAPGAPSYMYVATNDGHVWFTDADGQSWNECDSGLYNPNAVGAVQSMSVDPGNPEHIFAVTSQWWGTEKVWEFGSSTGWARDPCQLTWTSRSGPNNLTVYAIAVDWRYSTPNLYIGSDRGVFNSTNLGSSWLPFGSGLPNAQVFDLQSVQWTTSPSTTLLIAGTYGRSAFQSLLPSPPSPPSPAHPKVPVPTKVPTPAPRWVPPMQPPWSEGQRSANVPGRPAPQPKP